MKKSQSHNKHIIILGVLFLGTSYIYNYSKYAFKSLNFLNIDSNISEIQPGFIEEKIKLNPSTIEWEPIESLTGETIPIDTEFLNNKNPDPK